MSNIIKSDGRTEERTEILDKEDESTREAYSLLRRSGEKTKPIGMSYVGSFACHVYKDQGNGLVPPSYAFAALTPIGEATEGMCIIGFKRLQSRIFAFFGRKEPSVRK